MIYEVRHVSTRPKEQYTPHSVNIVASDKKQAMYKFRQKYPEYSIVAIIEQEEDN